jgi:hypothetical protein
VFCVDFTEVTLVARADAEDVLMIHSFIHYFFFLHSEQNKNWYTTVRTYVWQTRDCIFDDAAICHKAIVTVPIRERRECFHVAHVLLNVLFL